MIKKNIPSEAAACRAIFLYLSFTTTLKVLMWWFTNQTAVGKIIKSGKAIGRARADMANNEEPYHKNFVLEVFIYMSTENSAPRNSGVKIASAIICAEISAPVGSRANKTAAVIAA